MKNIRVMNFIFFILLLLSAQQVAISSGTPASILWKQTNGPYGGVVKALTFTSNGNLLAGVDQSGVFRSTNNGSQWMRTGLNNVSVTSFAVSTTGIIYAGTNGSGVFRSGDEGISWSQVNTGLANQIILSIAISAGGGVFAGTKEGVFISSNNGAVWHKSDSGLTENIIYSLTAGTGYVFATTPNGVFRSSDNGISWQILGFSGQAVFSFMVSPLNYYYAATFGGYLYCSTNNGANWNLTSVMGSTINALLKTPWGDLFAATYGNGIYRSDSTGIIWYQTSLYSGYILSLASKNENEIFAGSTVGVFYSGDNGTDWQKRNEGLAAVSINKLFLKSDGGIVAATENQGIYYTNDKGSRWLQFSNLPEGTYRSVLVTDSGTIFAGHVSNGIYCSTDNGYSWSPRNSGILSDSIVALEAKSNGLIFAATKSAGVYYSTDEGRQWNNSFGQTPPYAINDLKISPGGIVFAATLTVGVYKSVDDGMHWVQAGLGLPSTNILSIGFDSVGNTYASTESSRVFYSIDYGGTWVPTGFAHRVVTTATGPDSVIYAGVDGLGVYRATNSVDSPSQVSNGLFVTGVKSLIIDETNYLYAGVSGGSVFRASARTAGEISGNTFWDRNRNHAYDSPDTTLSGWKVLLKRLASNVLDSLAGKIDSVTTDSNGDFKFTNVADGKYIIQQVQQTGWIQTYPQGGGNYSLTLLNHEIQSGFGFGNARTHGFVGGSGGFWSNASNWQDNRVPVDTDAVEIPTDVVFDLLTTDTVNAIRLANGGRLTFSNDAAPLVINSRLEISEGAILTFPNTHPNPRLILHGDWVNEGTFDPENSTIIFAGDDPKVISSGTNSTEATTLKPGTARKVFAEKNQFNNLEISGDFTSSDGNIVVTNQLILHKSFYLASDDTLTIENSDPAAIVDTGYIFEGTVTRSIDGGSNDGYRFESPMSTIAFNGSEKPQTMSVTSMSGIHPDSVNLKWEVVNSFVDTDSNTITADSVGHFSRWVFGKPGTGFRKGKNSSMDYGTPKLARTYALSANGGSSDFSAQVKLRYEESELDPDMNESELQLLRGPFIVENVKNKWNMISLPLAVEDNAATSIFPTAISSAFSFEGSYQSSPFLSVGRGYWLKFSGDQEITILGEEVDSILLALQEGWNMIGTISIDINISSILSTPEENVTGSFFGYNNGYEIADVLQPLHSYWVKANSAGSMTLNSATSPAPKANLASSYLNSVNVLMIKDALGNQQTLYFDTENPHDIGRFLMPPVPPDGVFDARFGSGSLLEAVTGKELKKSPLKISSSLYPLTINWDKKQAKGTAILEVGDKSIPISEKGSITVSEQASEIMLELSNDSKIGIPLQFSLLQNYPNPFNPKTMIGYQIPVNSFVTLKIYNVLGQEVQSLVNEVQEAGYKTPEWDASNISSGVYFYRLEAKDVSTGKIFVQTKKMLVMK